MPVGIHSHRHRITLHAIEINHYATYKWHTCTSSQTCQTTIVFSWRNSQADSFIVNCNVSTPSPTVHGTHLGYPRVTVGLASLTLGLNLAKSTPLATRRKVANHSLRTPRGKQTSSKDIWGFSIPLQYIQIPASRSLQVPLHLKIWTLAI
jgi:hypothetical protein